MCAAVTAAAALGIEACDAVAVATATGVAGMPAKAGCRSPLLAEIDCAKARVGA